MAIHVARGKIQIKISLVGISRGSTLAYRPRSAVLAVRTIRAGYTVCAIVTVCAGGSVRTVCTGCAVCTVSTLDITNLAPSGSIAIHIARGKIQIKIALVGISRGNALAYRPRSAVLAVCAIRAGCSRHAA